MDCPNNHGKMELKRLAKEVPFRGRLVKYRPEHFVCHSCGLVTDDWKLAASNQKALSDAYRRMADLLSSEEIVEGRRKLGWNQEQLAKAANVGIASIKRWEGGLVQTKSMDAILRRALTGKETLRDTYTGNRGRVSLPRIKLVLGKFGKALGRKILRSSNTGVLYVGKYLFYADMIAFRELGQSMTGASYAAMPHGPQLDNYRELVSFIQEADEKESEPLTDQENRIIEWVAKAFPNDQSIYKAAHKEEVFRDKKPGEHILYTEAERLRQL
ncbi:MAG: type II TA system antitoxin MqsA family protein [Deltaproteobacteria bacterium]